MDLSNSKITFHKYQGKNFQELAYEITNKDKKYLNIFSKFLTNAKISDDKKTEVQSFLNYFYNDYNKPKVIIEKPKELWIPDTYTIQCNIKHISHIFHISDVHIRLYNRRKEYQEVFQKLYNLLESKITPNHIIVITGDLLHSKNNLSPECILITQNFLMKLASLAPTLLIAGNHDALLTNSQREDSITAITENIIIPNFYYLKNSGVYFIANLAIAVSSLLDNKWVFANTFTLPENFTHKIALYHGGVGIVDTGVGHRLRGEKLIEDFDGFDYVLLGDIHKFQFLDTEQKRIAYASSLIAQNFNEWNSTHGTLHWDLFTQNHCYYPIENNYGFFVFNLINNKVLIQDEEINPDTILNYLIHSSIIVKLNIKNCTHDFISKINHIVKSSSNDVKIIQNFLGNTIENKSEVIYDSSSLQNLLSEHIRTNNPTINDDELNFILEKYNQLSVDAEINNEHNISRWELIDLEFSNLFSYGQNNYINFSRFTSENPIGIIAPNSHGKSSLIDIILFTLFTKFSRSRGTGVSKDIININCTTFSSKLRFKIGSDIYIIHKEGKREQSDKIKIHKNEFYKENSGEILTDEDRKKTDKVINELIGTYDDFIFTNVQLQSRSSSFKEMTDKERKEYLYKVLKLNIWNEIVKKIAEHTKPLKSSISYLEKSLENKSSESLIEKVQEIQMNIYLIQDKIEQQLYEKEINLEKIESLRENLHNIQENKIQSELEMLQEEISKNNIKNLQEKIKELSQKKNYSKEEREKIIKDYQTQQLYITNLEKEVKPLQSLIPVSNLWKKIPYQNVNPTNILQIIKNEKLEINNQKTKLINMETNLKSTKEEYENIKDKLQQQKNNLEIYQNKIKEITKESNKQEIKLNLKSKIKEKDVVQTKIRNFTEQLEYWKQQESQYLMWKNEENIRKELEFKIKEKQNLEKILKSLETHEYDPKCKFCIKNPIVKQKKEKESELKTLKELISSTKISIHNEQGLLLEEEYEKSKEAQTKLTEKVLKLSYLENQITKLEIELEKENQIELQKKENENNQKIIYEIKLSISSLSEELSIKSTNIKEVEFKAKKNEIETAELQFNQYHEIILEIIEIDSKNEQIKKENEIINNLKQKIDIAKQDFESDIAIKYNQLPHAEIEIKLEISQLENKLQQEEYKYKENTKKIEILTTNLELIKENKKIRENISNFQQKITKNDNQIAKLNENVGTQHQQLNQLLKEKELYNQQFIELANKRNEYKLYQILEQSLGKDGLPLTILKNYLTPITESINNIISPFISRVIKLHVDNDDLIMDSFPTSGAEKSVYIHGGMESFILDIAFKITLSNFAKLPKCDFLFLDEGISAFDGERLSNINTLFNFIKRYFSKTILITHIDSVKESITEKINIVKENNFSKVVCEYT